MGTETVVADTVFTITSSGTTSTYNEKNVGNQSTQVNGTRVNKFWNTVEFNDQRVGPTRRRLKIETRASGDVDSQVVSHTVDQPYDPPYSHVPTPLPNTAATISDTGAPTHDIEVTTRYEVWHDDDLEFYADLGQSTLVEEN